MKAYLKNYRQSPRKVRLVANYIKGKDVSDALVHLDFLIKRASTPLKKLLGSAIANAKQKGFNESELVVKECLVDKGVVLKRFMPRAMGRAARINKRTSNVEIVLALKQNDSSGQKTKKTSVLVGKKNKELKKDLPEKKLTKKVKQVTKDKE